MTQTIPKPDFLDQERWDALIANRDVEKIRAASKAHVEAYIATGGSDETYVTQGGPTLLLWNTGRKTGREIIAPCNFMQDGDDVIVVGSIAGLAKHPHWALNLEAKPEGQVQVRDKRWKVKARKLEGAARRAMWPRLVEHFPLWGHFQKYCEREFMVFVLSPAEDA